MTPTDQELEEFVLEALDYRFGRNGKEELPERAFEMLESAAACDDPFAMFLVANMLKWGEGTERNRTAAFSFLERAAEMGEVNAVYSLGCCYMNGDMGNLGTEEDERDTFSIDIDIEYGLELYRDAAAVDHRLAVFRLGRYYYYDSKNSPESMAEALKWIRKGIELEEPSCMIDLADMHILGIGVSRDLAAAKRLYTLAGEVEGRPSMQNTVKHRLGEFDNLGEILRDER